MSETAQPVLQAKELLSERERIAGICEAAGARFAFLFGSMVDTTPGRAPRDVDIAVSFRDYDFQTYLELREQLSRALRNPEDRLDLVVLDRANPRLKLEALLTAVLGMRFLVDNALSPFMARGLCLGLKV